MVTHLENKFVKMGARLRVRDFPSGRSGGTARLDVQKDRQGEFFDIRLFGNLEVSVLDVQPADRHLLLLVRNEGRKSKFLCGHDERHWFVAAIPEAAPVGTVRQAKEALKPKEILDMQGQAGLKAKDRARRKTDVYKRQGEWFFVPADIKVDKRLVIKNEPLSRGRGSKPHMAEFCYRHGGETVYVCPRYPSGVNTETYNDLLKKDKAAKTWGWRVMVKDAAVYVRGRISHADHKTIVLEGWHRVMMNTENKAAAMRHVAFLD